ncbi:glycosyltransferase family 4 protein [Conexibacter woesei]|uniref:glycosyltransferase family 4 protein n=1 Tax=Conexibacter woesei TaxID=191495 RepID=UPI00040E2669|nr:glycosyltransferase family 4 protein [Conexibacter woesei]
MSLRAGLARRLRGAEPPLEAPRVPFMLEALRDGAAPLAARAAAEGGALRVALVIPQFRRGSGGHKTIADLVRGLEDRGHRLELLLIDEEGRHAGQADDAALRALFIDFFGPVGADVRRLRDPGAFGGADVVVATGWQTVPAVLRMPGAGARAYLVQDHEPEFYATSIEREWAAWTYRQGLHAICASPWLAELVTDMYGSTASSFDLGVDHDTYRNANAARSGNTILLYARPTTPRRAVPLALLALEELHRRRPSVDIALFGESRPIATPFPHRDLGVLTPPQLAQQYATATLGIVLSLTNPSLVPTEMLACGLPVVDLDVPSMRTTFAVLDALELAPPDPLALATAIDHLLDDPGLRAHRTATGLALTAQRTWPNAAAQVESGLRAALQTS